MKTPTEAKLNHQYKAQKQSLTQFDIYLKYSSSKEVSTKMVSEIFNSLDLNGKNILDIGCGDGSYLLQTLRKTKGNPNILFVEPSNNLYSKLTENTADSTYSIKTINQSFEEFYQDNNKKFDLILASHLYHFSRSEYEDFIKSLLSLLKPSGKLIWIERGVDDISGLKKTFKPKILPSKYPKGWEPRDFRKAHKIFKRISKEKNESVEMFTNQSTLTFPFKESMEDTVDIIEFYLNIEWSSLSTKMQNEILDYIKDMDGVLTEKEGIIVYTKNSV